MSFNTETTAWVTPKRDELIVIIPKLKFGDRVRVSLDGFGYGYIGEIAEGVVIDINPSDSNNEDEIKVTIKDDGGGTFTGLFESKYLYPLDEEIRIVER